MIAVADGVDFHVNSSFSPFPHFVIPAEAEIQPEGQRFMNYSKWILTGVYTERSECVRMTGNKGGASL